MNNEMNNENNNDFIISNTNNNINKKNIYFNQKWTLWFHKMTDTNWEKKTYRKVYTFDNINDFWKMYNNLPNITSFLLFLMKDGVYPIYEDPIHINGGCWSYRVFRKDLQNAWLELCISSIGEIFQNKDDITGISVNPKNCVLKVWSKTLPETHLISNEKLKYIDLNKHILMSHRQKSDESKVTTNNINSDDINNTTLVT